MRQAIQLVCLGLVALYVAGARAGHVQGAAASVTVRQALEQVGATTEGLSAAALARSITSYATLVEGDEIGIAYYEDHGDGLLHEPLFVAYKAQRRPWIERELRTAGGEPGPFGSVLRMTRAGSFLLLDCHGNPSAGRLLVLTRQLDVVSELQGFSPPVPGFSMKSLPDGLILFVRNMVHFAPAHPAEIALYDAAARRETQLYPTDTATPARLAFIKRLEPIYRQWERVQPGHVYGYDPTWFDVQYHAASYDAEADTLHLGVVFSADRHPASIAPPQQMAVTVVCRQMKSAARRCEETAQR